MFALNLYKKYLKNNKLNYCIGIIGKGFVGGAISDAFSSVYEIKVFDLDPKKGNDSLESVNNCDFVFICVPTPMLKNGNQDLSKVFNVFENLTDKPIYILKSTVLPGTCDRLSEKYPYLNLVFSPEFLTEKNAKQDILNQSRAIFGGQFKNTEKVKKIFLSRFSDVKVIQTDFKTAELIKYMNNVFLATKVSIMNEFKLLNDKIGADWEKALIGFALDKRIGKSHLNVPGPDGNKGYGGTCFPKDVNAFLSLGKSYNVKLNTVLGGWKTNLNVRPEKDWENNYGRSVSFKK